MKIEGQVLGHARLEPSFRILFLEDSKLAKVALFFFYTNTASESLIDPIKCVK